MDTFPKETNPSCTLHATALTLADVVQVGVDQKFWSVTHFNTEYLGFPTPVYYRLADPEGVPMALMVDGRRSRKLLASMGEMLVGSKAIPHVRAVDLLDPDDDFPPVLSLKTSKPQVPVAIANEARKRFLIKMRVKPRPSGRGRKARAPQVPLAM